MALQSVTYRVNNWLACAGCLPASVFLCLTPDIVVPPDCFNEDPQAFIHHTIEAEITAVVKVSGGSCLANQYYEYTIEFDTDDITIPILGAENITGIICAGCLTTFIQETAGDEIYVEDNEDGSSTLFSQHGCEYLFISGGELTNLLVVDTNSIDLSLVGVSPKTLSADLIVDPAPGNQLSVSGAGVFVAGQWALLGNSGIIDGVNFLGTTDNIAFDIRVNNFRARRTVPAGTPGEAANLIDGYDGNTIGFFTSGNTIAGGGSLAFVNNIPSGNYNFIGAGSDNFIGQAVFGPENGNFIGAGLSNSIIDGKLSVLAGGEQNELRGAWSFLGGGISNLCSIASAAIGEMVLVGGRDNTVFGQVSALVGGQNNTIGLLSIYGFIGGGQTNTITGTANTHAVVGGGFSNQIINASHFSVICGGEQANISGSSTNSFIGGGFGCSISATATHCSVVGGSNNGIDSALFAFIGGGSQNVIDVGADFGGVIAGENNRVTATCTHSIICGGESNLVGTGVSPHSFIGGGELNQILIDGDHCVIVGGGANTVTGGSTSYNFIGGGNANTINTTDFSAICGGETNQLTSNATHGFIGSGEGNSLAGGTHSSIVGGQDNDMGGGTHCTIVGGQANVLNSATGPAPAWSVILGGQENIIDGAVYGAILGGIGNELIVNAAITVSSILGGGSLRLGDFSVGFNNPSSLTPPYFPAQVDVSAFPEIAYFGDVDVWIGNVDNDAGQLVFWCSNVSLNYTASVYSSFRAGLTQVGGNFEYVWPVDTPAAGDALRVQSVALPQVILEWAP